MRRGIGVAVALAVGAASFACGGDAGESRAVPTDTAAAPAAVTETAAAVPAAGAAPADTPSAPLAAPTGTRDSMPPPSASAGTAAPQDSALALLRRTAERYGSTRAMQATFAMETKNPLLGQTVKSRGELFQRRPDRLLMRFTEPSGDVIVSDGQWIWVWYPSLDSTQVLRSPAGSGSGTVDLLAQFVGDPTRRFSWSVGPTETVDGHAATMYTLDPLGDEAYTQLVVWIDRDDALVRRFEVTEPSGVERRIELHGLRLDSTLPDSLFRFTPPPGARIVGAP